MLQAGLQEFHSLGKLGQGILSRGFESLRQDRFGGTIDLRRISQIMSSNPFQPLQGTSGIVADVPNGGRVAA